MAYVEVRRKTIIPVKRALYTCQALYICYLTLSSQQEVLSTLQIRKLKNRQVHCLSPSYTPSGRVGVPSQGSESLK